MEDGGWKKSRPGRLSRTGKKSCSKCAILGYSTTKEFPAGFPPNTLNMLNQRLKGRLARHTGFTAQVKPNKPSVTVANPVFVPSLLGCSFLTCGIEDEVGRVCFRKRTAWLRFRALGRICPPRSGAAGGAEYF
jgi:hypothetical protein